MNPEGGSCSMPTQFLGTVQVGNLHRIPRWMAVTQNSVCAQYRPQWTPH